MIQVSLSDEYCVQWYWHSNGTATAPPPFFNFLVAIKVPDHHLSEKNLLVGFPMRTRHTCDDLAMSKFNKLLLSPLCLRGNAVQAVLAERSDV
jgi:hypothetical protein